MALYYIVSGGFDPIHEGHIEMIKSSAEASDVVIVLSNSDAWLCRKKGKNFHSMKILRAILENLKGVIDVLEFDDSDNSASDGIRKARAKYLNDRLVFARRTDWIQPKSKPFRWTVTTKFLWQSAPNPLCWITRSSKKYLA
jgi:cytidyltransferase-like protein